MWRCRPSGLELDLLLLDLEVPLLTRAHCMPGTSISISTSTSTSPSLAQALAHHLPTTFAPACRLQEDGEQSTLTLDEAQVWVGLVAFLLIVNSACDQPSEHSVG